MNTKAHNRKRFCNSKIKLNVWRNVWYRLTHVVLERAIERVCVHTGEPALASKLRVE